MSDCGCDKAREMLEEYVHHELCDGDAVDIRRHLETCRECQGEHQVNVVLSQVIARGCCETAPSELRRQVMLKLRQITVTHSA